MTSATATVLYSGPYGGPYTADMARRPIIGAQQAREKFSDLLDRVKEGEHPIVVRRSTAVGIVVPPEWYHRAAELMGDPWEDWTPPPAKAD